MPNESQQFLDQFNQKEVDAFDFLKPEGTNEPAPLPTEDAPEDNSNDPEPRNRRERRLMEKLQGEREASIALSARLDALTETQKVRSTEAEFLNVAERIYGTQTPELREATELLKTALMGVKEEAKREAIEEYRSMRQKEQEAVTTAERRIDSMLEDIEDEKNIELTSAHRTNYLKLLEKMSPKDRDGNIVEYADHHAVWDIYQDQLNARKVANPAKDMASRAMVQGGGTKESNLSNDSTERFLRDNGII